MTDVIEPTPSEGVAADEIDRSTLIQALVVVLNRRWGGSLRVTRRAYEQAMTWRPGTKLRVDAVDDDGFTITLVAPLPRLPADGTVSNVSPTPRPKVPQ